MAQNRMAEAKLKAAVVDRLMSTGVLDADSVLVSELTVANWTHRTDMVVANGRLWGFELKSDRDSLDRLPTQLVAFSALFEKLVVVVAEKFESRATQLVQEVEGVGLWISRKSGELVERIRPKVMPLDAGSAISLMTSEELRLMLRARGLRGLHGARRKELVDLASHLSAAELADAARSAIKARFRDVHARFMTAQTHAGTLEALPLLRRNPSRSERVPQTVAIGTRVDPVLPEVPLDHPNLVFAPSGPVIARLVR